MARLSLKKTIPMLSLRPASPPTAGGQFYASAVPPGTELRVSRGIGSSLLGRQPHRQHVPRAVDAEKLGEKTTG
eukprot:CAMPEP_0204266318 /NCGR_PEP_ID=MMETSP0468-20130131/10249_1 /ASSEMBLY_ACC=CAM_ASM_000383 /TAXON_ID=2969 /ORGANISM="Oxyrrhis marina" /LENGTH=73 /DNA_ID=CAMNT_0051241371 /DNA_START=32 /DNA_END=253 /DNA_ORIENTATION=-